MGRFSRIFTPLFLGALLVACSNLSEREAYSVFAEEFAPKPMACTVSLNESFSYNSVSAGGMTVPTDVHSNGSGAARDTAMACMKYFGAAGAISKLECWTSGCSGVPEGHWNFPDRVLTFKCGEWSKAHMESITTRDRDATVSFSRTPSLAGGDALAAAPAECKPSFKEADGKGTVYATRDDSGKWRK